MWSNERYRHIVTALYGILLECFDTFCSFLWQCFKDLGQSQKARKMCEAAFSMNAVSKEVDLLSVFTCISLGLFHLIFFVSLSKIHQESHYKLSQNNTLLTSVLFWITFFFFFFVCFLRMKRHKRSWPRSAQRSDCDDSNSTFFWKRIFHVLRVECVPIQYILRRPSH